MLPISDSNIVKNNDFFIIILILTNTSSTRNLFHCYNLCRWFSKIFGKH